MERPEKITKLAYYLMDKEPLFYLFIINTDFILDEECFGSDYAAVSYSNSRVNLYYTSKFLSLPIQQMYFVIIHESYHIFKKHLSIHADLQKKNVQLVNIAEDAIINSEIRDSSFNGISPDSEGLNPFFVPDDFIKEYSSIGKDAFVTPRLFNWYMKKSIRTKREILLSAGNCKNIETGKYGRIQYECDSFQVAEFPSLEDMIKNSGKETYQLTNLPSSMVHIDNLIPVFINSNNYSFDQAIYEGESESYGFSDSHERIQESSPEMEPISQQVFTQKIIKQARDMVDNNPQIQKHAGKNSGNSILEKLEKLMSPEVSWKKVFKKHVNLYNSENSISKSKKKSYLTYIMNAKSRNGFIFPHYLRVKNKLQKYVFVAVDVSGSCFSDSYDTGRFFAEIDSMAEEFRFNGDGKVFVIQWDWNITKPFIEYKKGDWKKFELRGGGGTNPGCIFNHLSNILSPIGNSLVGHLDFDKKVPFIVPDKNKLPLLIVLTDGYFYGKLQKEDLGYYKGNEKSVLFVTKSNYNLFDGANSIEFK